jgi:signal transduction histidine kinase
VITAVLTICGVASLILAVLVGFQDAKRLANLLFVGICLCFSLWSFGVMLFLQTDNASTALITAKAYYLAAGFFPALLLIFSLIYPTITSTKKPSRFTIGLVGLAGVSIAALVLFYPDFIITAVAIEDGRRTVTINSLTYILYTAYFVTFFAFAIGVALSKLATYKGHARMQAGLYSIGILINSIPGFITNLYLPYFGTYDYIWVGPLMSIAFLGLTTYGIVRHRMFSVRLAAVRSTAYVFSIALLLGLYYLIVLLVVYLFPQEQSLKAFSPLNVIITIVLVLLFQPVKRFFDKVTNKLFYRDYYNLDEFFGRLNRIVSSSSDLHSLLKRVSHEIADTMKSEQVFFTAINADNQIFTVGTQHHGSLPPEDVLLFRHAYPQPSHILVADLIDENSEVRRAMASHKLAIVLPLVRDDVFLGFLNLGYHKVSRYISRDVRTLRAIADELGIAIQNALSLQEVKDINSHLEQRIDAATKELRSSNAQLQRLDEVKDEFISMASHQLRTPLTSIKGYISMLLEGDMGEVTKEQKHVLNEAFISSERMVRLIGDFLNVSRLQTGKFVIEKRPVDLARMVQHEVDALEANASARGIRFIYEAPKGLPMIEVDENKLQQVVMNFADNAIYYSPDGSKVLVSLKKVKNAIEFTVVDSGIGVPQAEQSHLFKKFYRAPNARKARPDGTGVGLYLAKKVVDAHGGEVLFESTEGKGSTFGFRIPIS